MKFEHSASAKLLLPGLFGSAFNVNAGTAPQSDLDQMRTALNSALPTENAIYESHSCGVVGGSIHPIREKGVAAIIGTPYWQDNNLVQLAAKTNPAAALAAAYIDSGPNFINQLMGAFSFVVIDPVENRLLAGIDRLGQQPLYYAVKNQGIVFGSTAGTVLGHSSIDRRLTEQGIFDYLYFHMVPSPVSIFEGIKKVPAGHYLDFSDGQLSIHRYWKPVFMETPSCSFQEMGVELHSILRNAVIKSAGTAGPIGAFLSGGLDSSTVSGMLAKTTQGKAQAYSIGFSAEGYDEMEYARIAAKHFGMDLHEYYVTPEDVIDALPTIAASYDEPFGNSSALPAYFCAKLAADNGIRRLMAGDGGDEVFAGNERYAKQSVFEIYHRVPPFLRNGLLDPLLDILPRQFPLVSKARSYVEQARLPLPDRLQTYNFLHRHDPYEIFSDDFLAQVDTEAPLRLQRDIFNVPDDASKLNRMLYLDWQYTLADNDLRKVSHMCALAGVEVVYPMLDDRLVEFSCQIPTNWKMKGRNLRHFYKEAMRDFLPKETISKKKQGFGLPFGVWMQTHKPLRELAYDSLLRLKKHGYFKPEFIDQTIMLHRDSHAAYYGDLVWILTVLDIWLDHHSSGNCADHSLWR